MNKIDYYSNACQRALKLTWHQVGKIRHSAFILFHLIFILEIDLIYDCDDNVTHSDVTVKYMYYGNRVCFAGSKLKISAEIDMKMQ